MNPVRRDRPRRARRRRARPRRPALGGVALATLAATALAVVAVDAAPASAQTLERRVAEAPDGWVRFAFEVREGVCGRRGGIHVSGHDGRCDCDCEPGPMWVDLEVVGGEVERLEASVGPEPEPREGRITDVGRVEPTEATAFLLDLAERARGKVGEDAIFPAVVARDVVTWPRLLEIARQARIPRSTREAAVFWVGQAASEKAVEGLESVIRDEGELEVRKHAVFALSRHESGRALDALLEVARTSPEPELRKSALFWLGRRADEDPRVLALFEEILGG